jgi:multidrug efflux system outer membrane protein
MRKPFTMKTPVALASALVAAMALSACAVIHSDSKPAATGYEWRSTSPHPDPQASGQPGNEAFAKEFWTAFNDPALNALEDEALRSNTDVRVAAANVEAYRARLQATDADRYPQVNLSAQGARGKGLTFGPHTTDSWLLGLNLSWELDLWGRLTRATDAARADLLVQSEVQRGVYLTLAANVAQNYFTLRQLDAQLDIARHTVELRKQSLDLFKLRFDGGVVSEVEYSQVASEYEQAVAAVPQLEASIARLENALSVLLGRNPGPVARGKALTDLSVPDVPAGLSSQLLARRPDIRQAEAQLAAADARVDSARLAYFPTISLTGLLGLASPELSSLTDGNSKVWSAGGGLVQPLFNAGQISAGVDSAKAAREASLAQYQRAVQNGFREVDDALVSRGKLREQLDAATRQVAALQRYAELSRLRYENGQTSYLEVIDAERSLFSAQVNQVSVQNALLTASVDLYRALGGQWMDERIKAASAPAQAPAASGGG